MVLRLPEAQSLSKRQRRPAPLLLVLKDGDQTRKALLPETGNARLKETRLFSCYSVYAAHRAIRRSHGRPGEPRLQSAVDASHWH